MEVHIGREIEKKFEESGLKPGEFAKRISTGPRNIYNIFKKQDVNAQLLRKISEVLNFDFFTLYREQLPAAAKEVKEPATIYRASKKAVAVIVELDGMDETLDDWFIRLRKINSTI